MITNCRLLLSALIGVGVSYTVADAQQIVLERMFPDTEIEQILGLEAPDNGESYVYALSQQGLIYRLDTDDEQAEKQVWLDITDRVVVGGERGLLGLAFHPEYQENGRVYINYIAPDPERTVISRFLVSGGVVDEDSEEVLLEFDQPRSNHNGGQITFGPDGYLYIASGDGGGSGDPNENGQNPETLLGAMLRIDVDQSNGDLLYGIPEDNPFADSEDGRDEIFAYGLRNPWRFSFDRQTGLLWTGDVGEDEWEAIHIIENGNNYGWNIVEGSNCFPPEVTECDKSGLEMPIYEYEHGPGRASITGGYVYRGERNPVLYGRYIYGDYVTGQIWALNYDEETEEVVDNTELLQSDYMISSFGENGAGEIYVLSYTTGEIFQIRASPDTVRITSPEPGELVRRDHTITWEEMPGADSYRIQISMDDSFSDPEIDVETESAGYDAELDDGVYYVRVRAKNEAGEGPYSEPLSYEVENATFSSEDDEVPVAFELSEAYPNPFNPVTNLNFAVPVEGRVVIAVYDVTGQRITEVTNQVYQPGKYQVKVDGSGWASGTYLVTARLEGEVRTRLITLLK